MADIFDVQIITPERVFYQGQAGMVELTTVEGDMGVYPNHIPLTAVIAPGIVTITEAEGKKKCAVHSGFVEILPDKVTILAEVAEWPDEIDLDRARAAEDRARERLNAKSTGLDVMRAELALKRALVRQDILS